MSEEGAALRTTTAVSIFYNEVRLPFVHGVVHYLLSWCKLFQGFNMMLSTPSRSAGLTSSYVKLELLSLAITTPTQDASRITSTKPLYPFYLSGSC